ncbi:Caveolin [Aphelenchoides fujianensis]|nr:Caveolin [Aphelenchoides fujianensis]
MTTEETKIELGGEQTPLKLDTDAPAVSDVQTEVVVQPLTAEITQAEKKKWWQRKGPKKAEDGSEKPAPADKEAGAEDNNVPPAKKSHWWQGKPCKAACGEGTTFGVDYTRRDEQGLQTALDLSFAEVFAEADALHSLNGVWRVTHSIFTGVRNFFYKVFTIILCVPAAFLFGLLFALVSALGVFVIIPAGRLLSIPAGWLFKLWSTVVLNVLEPVAAGIATLFSRIKIYRTGLHNDPTAQIGA